MFSFFIFTDGIRSMGEGNVFTSMCHSVPREALFSELLREGGLLPEGWVSGQRGVRCLVRGCLVEGVSAQRGLRQTPSPRWLLPRSERILPECILVFKKMEHISPFCGATDTPALDLSDICSGF